MLAVLKIVVDLHGHLRERQATSEGAAPWPAPVPATTIEGVLGLFGAFLVFCGVVLAAGSGGQVFRAARNQIPAAMNAEVVDCRVREAVDRAPDVSYVPSLPLPLRRRRGHRQHVAAFSNAQHGAISRPSPRCGAGFHTIRSGTICSRVSWARARVVGPALWWLRRFRMNVSGALITFEGVQGSGKTTQMMRLGRWLRRQGRKVEHTREPDGTRLGVAVRGLFKRPGMQPKPLVEVFLFMAARQQHVAEKIRRGSSATASCSAIAEAERRLPIRLGAASSRI